MNSSEQLQKDMQSALHGHSGPIDRKRADAITEAVYEHAKRIGTVKEFKSVFDANISHLAVESLIESNE